jgi:hypothetical protein
MTRILITSLALCLLLLSAGKSYASANSASLGAPASTGGHDVMSMQVCNTGMEEACDDMHGGSAGLFSHFHCHLNMTSLVTGYSSIGLTGLPSPNYNYQFSSKVHIQALSTKPPQVA